MSISGIEAAGFTPYVAPTLSSQGLAGAAGTSGTAKVGDPGKEFGHLVVDGLDRLQAVQSKSDGLAVQAATGDLDAMHQYTIASTEASVSTQLTVALRNKAIEAFNEIIRMPVG
jgi:flagellar hook-basal body complex protein FliE